MRGFAVRPAVGADGGVQARDRLAFQADVGIRAAAQADPSAGDRAALRLAPGFEDEGGSHHDCSFAISSRSGGGRVNRVEAG